MTALYAARNTSHSSGFDKSNVPTLSVSQFIPSGVETPSDQRTIRAISHDPRDNTRARSADMYEIPAPDFCGANTSCSASSPGAQLTGGADFPVEAPPAFLSEIHHDHVHCFFLHATLNDMERVCAERKSVHGERKVVCR